MQFLSDNLWERRKNFKSVLDVLVLNKINTIYDNRLSKSFSKELLTYITKSLSVV
jgi:hypothetical protein